MHKTPLTELWHLLAWRKSGKPVEETLSTSPNLTRKILGNSVVSELRQRRIKVFQMDNSAVVSGTAIVAIMLQIILMP
jgi:hypothetical protein